AVATEALRIRREQFSSLEAELQEARKAARGLRQLVAEGEAARRGMHARIQELSGSVRVFVRVRPFLPGDGEGASAGEVMRP
ncbi:unnamed protein product, partial [Discosporangium mesarthrocarpum]